jgi:hypothetical protein
MSRGPSTFRQQDLTRALKATVGAGLSIARIEIDRSGKIVVFPGRPQDVQDVAEVEANPWDTIA